MAHKKVLKLKGKTAVFVDWANAYNWKDSLKWEIDLQKLFTYLKAYKEIKEISFYFGSDEYPASKQQIKEAREIGYQVISKNRLLLKKYPLSVGEGRDCLYLYHRRFILSMAVK